jgi:hypothetical protein
LAEIPSIEVFVEEYLMPGMRKGIGSFRRLPLDRLRLATKMTKNSPVYVENKADCKQTTLELLKWFPQSAGREWTVYVIFEREEVAGERDVSDEAEKKPIKDEKGQGKKKRGRPSKKEESREEPREESFRLPRNLRLPENFGLEKGNGEGEGDREGEGNGEEEWGYGDEGNEAPETISRKRSFSNVSTPREPVTRQRTRGQGK